MSSSVESPAVYIIAGPNGAGKTTFAAKFLPDFVDCREFLNADLIAAGLSPFAPERQNLRAGRLLLSRIKELAESKQEFGFETTLAGRSHVRLLAGMKDNGYRVFLFFLWLPSADLAVARVANRVRQGGHNIAEPVIRRRFKSGLRNFFHLYRPLLDAWWLVDASLLPPKTIAREEDRELTILKTPTVESNQVWRRNPMSEKASNDVLASKVDAAFRQAAAKVVQRARETGTPVVVWEDDQVKEIPTDEIEIRTPPAESERSES